MTMKHTIIAALAGLLTLGVAGDALAQRRTNELAKDVAVRHRRLLVKERFELAPLFESTINADFQHIIGGGAKLEYHFSDMLSFGAVGVASIALKTGLVEKIVRTLDTQDMKNMKERGPDGMAGTADDIRIREPSQEEFNQRLNTMPLHGAVYASLTPWYGKLAAFSQAFVAFDFYFQAGLAFATLKSNCDSVNVCNDMNAGKPPPEGDQDPNNDPPLNDGSRFGLYLGGGIHVFLNDFIALDLTVRDYAFSDNPSGADFDARIPQSVTKDDSRFVHHLFVGAGLSIMLPPKVKRTP